MRQVVVEPRRRAQHFGFRLRQHTELCGVVEHRKRRDIEDVGLFRGVNELQILRDEIDVDEAARGMFQIPDIGLAFFLRDRAAHVGDVNRGARRIARPGQHGANDVLDLLAQFRG